MFKKLLEERNIENVTVESAGLAAFLNDPASDNAVEAMKEKGGGPVGTSFPED